MSMTMQVDTALRFFETTLFTEISEQFPNLKITNSMNINDLDFGYKYHSYCMMSSRMLLDAVQEKITNDTELMFKSLCSFIGDKYNEKWDSLFTTLLESEYNALADIEAQSEEFRNKNFVNVSSDVDTIDKVKNEDGSNSSTSQKEDTNETQESNNQSRTQTTFENVSEEIVEDESIYGYNSNIAAPTNSNSSTSGNSSTRENNESNDNSLSKNELLSSKQNLVGNTTNKTQEKESRFLDSKKEGDENVSNTYKKSGRNSAAADLILKEINVKRKNLLDIVYNDIDSIIALNVF